MVTFQEDEDSVTLTTYVDLSSDEEDGDFLSPEDVVATEEFVPFFFFSEDDMIELTRDAAGEAIKKAPKAKDRASLLSSSIYPKVSVDGGRDSVLRSTEQEIKCLFESYQEEFPGFNLNFTFFCSRFFGPKSKLAAHFETQYSIGYQQFCKFLTTVFVSI